MALFIDMVWSGRGARLLVVCALWGIWAWAAWADIRTMEIPNRSVLAAGGLGILSAPLFPELGWEERCLGFFCVSLFLLLVNGIAPGAVGGGDIKLVAAGGLFLGWRQSLWSFSAAMLAAGVVCVWMLLSGRADRKSRLPLGPFLCLGMALAAGRAL